MCSAAKICQLFRLDKAGFCGNLEISVHSNFFQHRTTQESNFQNNISRFFFASIVTKKSNYVNIRPTNISNIWYCNLKVEIRTQRLFCCIFIHFCSLILFTAVQCTADADAKLILASLALFQNNEQPAVFINGITILVLCQQVSRTLNLRVKTQSFVWL